MSTLEQVVRKREQTLMLHAACKSRDIAEKLIRKDRVTALDWATLRNLAARRERNAKLGEGVPGPGAYAIDRSLARARGVVRFRQPVGFNKLYISDEFYKRNSASSELHYSSLGRQASSRHASLSQFKAAH
jgi:hypothetical protein